MKFLAIIPARKNSKSIKNKNFVKFCSKPLIYWTIEAALKSKNLDHIIVSTDSIEIRRYAKKFNLSTPHLRPKRFSTDEASTLSVINYEVEELEKKNHHFDYIVLLQPTSPIRDSLHIDEAINLIKLDKKADSLVSCIKLPHNFSPESLMIKKKEYLYNSKFSKKIFRRQDKKKYYARNGASIYITKRSKLKKYIFGGKILGYEMDWIYSIDIDNNEDLELAKIIKKYVQRKNEK